MNAKDFLKQAYRLNELVNSNVAELENLKALSTSVSGANYGAERVQGGNLPGSRIEAIVLKIVDLEREIQGDINRYLDLKKAIREAINGVENQNEKLILRYRYVELLSWSEIQARMGLDERQTYIIHGKALKNIKIPELQIQENAVNNS